MDAGKPFALTGQSKFGVRTAHLERELGIIEEMVLGIHRVFLDLIHKGIGWWNNQRLVILDGKGGNLL